MLRGFIDSRRYKTSGKNKAVREYIISFPGVDSVDKAKLLIGKKVEYRDGDLKIKGSIIATHGVRGRLGLDSGKVYQVISIQPKYS